MVRAYILTERERGILEHFMKSGQKLNGFTVLIHYLKKSRTQLSKDLELIDAAINRVEA